MAKKNNIAYVCNSCGQEHVKWLGKCSGCGEFNTIVEFKVQPSGNEKTSLVSRSWTGSSQKTIKFSDVEVISEQDRYKTGLNEFDRAIGGGIMPTGAYLLSGEPGAGKSTLLIQVACYLSSQGKKVLYVSAEENLEQLKHRANRLDLNSNELFGITNNNIEIILEEIAEIKPDIVIVDSIQVLYSNNVNSSIGSVSQVQTCASALNTQSKQMKHSLLIIGHITKDGSIAGPKNFEHMVDVVLKLENEGNSVYRSITANKNRFGENETGFFEMTGKGLISIDNPSNIFLPQNQDNEQANTGSIFVMNKGNRSVLVEIQSLIEQQVYNSPKRIVSGLDINRFHILLALNNKYFSSLVQFDVYSSVLQGVISKESDADLPIFISLFLAMIERNISNKMVSFGEISLNGAVRAVKLAENRVKTAYKLGFNQIILPYQNKSEELTKFQKENPDLELYYVKHVQDLNQILTTISKENENNF